MEDYKIKTTCRICGNKKLIRIADFGNIPLANSLVKNGLDNVTKYPLDVYYCPTCSLTTLGVVVNPKILYNDYCYHSSVSGEFRKHCGRLGNTLRHMTAKQKPLVVDIASNDGCLLRELKDIGFDVLGVEPADNLSQIARAQGIETITKFWSSKIRLKKKADFITAMNVFAHVDDIRGFLDGVVSNLVDGGVFVIEVPWLLNLIRKNQFDTIYHEHLSYFLLKPIMMILKEFSLTVFGCDIVDIHGGSLRVYATNNEHAHKVDDFVMNVIQTEIDEGMYNTATYEEFYSNVIRSIGDFKLILKNIRHKKVAGFCASAKGISFLNYCGIGNDTIKMIADDTPYKQGKFTPGSLIPIVSAKKLKEFNPDYIVVFSWNFVNEIKKKTSWFTKRYIIPIPYARVE